MTERRASFHSNSPDSTAKLAKRLGARLSPGDCLLLSGELGTGKSHLARALIQSLLTEPEDIPSPTFTLVQTYDIANAELWHADLYRLSAPDQVIELGLIDAFETAISLVEWPERLEGFAPQNALRITLSYAQQSEARDIAFEWVDEKWTPIVRSMCHGD